MTDHTDPQAEDFSVKTWADPVKPMPWLMQEVRVPRWVIVNTVACLMTMATLLMFGATS
jgi:hypothetical protein